MQSDAKTDWDDRISVRSDETRELRLPDLDPPAEVTAVGGIGQVTIDWTPVRGAVGYLILRGPDDASLEPVDHHSGDVLSIPAPPYVDTTGTPGTEYRYAVASVPEVTVHGRPSASVAAEALVADGKVPDVRVVVDAVAEGTELPRPWAPMIGSERLSQLLCKDLSGGREIGVELEQALRRMHDEVGVRTVRAHAIFHDDTRVYTEVGGEPVYDFSIVDAIYDKLLGIGLRPVVELGFMPRDLASDPKKTVFEYGAIISPPHSWDRWGELVHRLVSHLVDRYGLDEVLGWDFEVWNEANLEVFWSGTKAEWMRLYDVSAAAVKAVDRRLAVGGPSSAAAGWVDDLLAHAAAVGSPVDFVSTHTYGSPPSTYRRRLIGTGSVTRGSCGRSGASPRRTSTRSTTRSSQACSCSAGCARRPGGWTPLPTGSPPTTSRNLADRLACCMAASACRPWADFPSPGFMPSRSSTASGRTNSRSPSRAMAAAA